MLFNELMKRRNIPLRFRQSYASLDRDVRLCPQLQDNGQPAVAPLPRYNLEMNIRFDGLWVFSNVKARLMRPVSYLPFNVCWRETTASLRFPLLCMLSLSVADFSDLVESHEHCHE